MSNHYVRKITKVQQQSLLRKWKQNDQGLTYRQFRKTVQECFGNDSYIVVPWCGMVLGIETDGHTHS
jgi:hypothetical protein